MKESDDMLDFGGAVFFIFMMIYNSCVREYVLRNILLFIIRISHSVWLDSRLGSNTTAS